jgi:hypothetical protein
MKGFYLTNLTKKIKKMLARPQLSHYDTQIGHLRRTLHVNRQHMEMAQP